MAKKLPIEQHAVRTSFTTDRATFERVEAWRAEQRPPLTRSAAWRALAARALGGEAKAGA